VTGIDVVDVTNLASVQQRQVAQVGGMH
jgi:hypothetical protein